MKTLLSTICAAAMMLGVAAPLQAAPIVPQVATPASADVIQVQQNRSQQVMSQARRDKRIQRWADRREWRGDSRDWRRDRHWRGHRHWRHRDRDNDVAIGLGAFAAGALLGGALNSGPRVVHRGNAHVEWCYDRYRSYRASDNTFQPYNGPRKQCYSPYS